MIDLDPFLAPWTTSDPSGAWTEAEAVAFADELVGPGLRNTWDPVAEDMISVSGDDGIVALVSIYFPIAVVASDVPGDVSPGDGLSGVGVARVSSLYTPELSASPDVLRRTLLRGAWDESRIDPTGFTGWDLFVETS